MLGTGVELVLAKHSEDAWQLAPLVLLTIGILVLTPRPVRQRRGGLRVVQALMILFVVNGCIGIVLHYRAKTEFALERHPALSGLALLREALKGASPPLLAPGAMIGLGLLGLAWTYGHPAFQRRADRPPNTIGELP